MTKKWYCVHVTQQVSVWAMFDQSQPSCVLDIIEVIDGNDDVRNLAVLVPEYAGHNDPHNLSRFSLPFRSEGAVAYPEVSVYQMKVRVGDTGIEVEQTPGMAVNCLNIDTLAAVFRALVDMHRWARNDGLFVG